MDYRRVAAGVLLIAGVAVAVHLITLRPPTHAARTLQDTPWIVLPRSGTDASGLETRQLLSRLGSSGHGFHDATSLYFTCGSESSFARIRNRYIAHVAKDAYNPGWRVILDMQGEDAEITWSLDGLVGPPPPPPMPSRTKDDGAVLVTPTQRTTLHRDQLERVRRAWDTDTLWHSSQDNFLCHDGNAVLLEACIDGQYAVRMRNCSSDHFAASHELLQALTELLAAPEEPYWRRPDGSRITGQDWH